MLDLAIGVVGYGPGSCTKRVCSEAIEKTEAELVSTDIQFGCYPRGSPVAMTNRRARSRRSLARAGDAPD